MEAMVWQNSDPGMPKLWIVSKDTSEPKNNYKHIAENVEKIRKIDILKQQIRTINSRKTHDEMVDCISQALLWAKKKEEEVMRASYENHKSGIIDINYDVFNNIA